MVEQMQFTKSNGSATSCMNQQLVYCRCILGFVDYIKARRNIQDIQLLVGIDGGQGSLKFILTIEDLHDASNKPNFKDSGVQRCFLLAIAENVQENFENVEKIWTKLELSKIDAIVTGIIVCFIY